MGGCGDGVIEFLNDACKMRGRGAGALRDRGGAGAAAGGVSDRHRRHGDHRKRGAPGAFPGRHRHRRHRHRRHRHAERDYQRILGGRNDRRARQRRPAGPREHAHARADGHVSRTRRRPGADGLAAEIHFTGRGEDGVAGDGAHRHAAGRARDDRVGHDHVRRHVLLRRGDREDDARRRAARRARPDDHPVPGRRREDAGRGAEARRVLHQIVQERQPDRAGGRAARALHERRGDACRLRGARAQVRRAGHHPSRGNRRRGEDRARAASGDAGRISGVARLLGAAHARGARRLGERR